MWLHLFISKRFFKQVVEFLLIVIVKSEWIVIDLTCKREITHLVATMLNWCYQLVMGVHIPMKWLHLYFGFLSFGQSLNKWRHLFDTAHINLELIAITLAIESEITPLETTWNWCYRSPLSFEAASSLMWLPFFWTFLNKYFLQFPSW